jgi:hypothetical protein
MHRVVSAAPLAFATFDVQRSELGLFWISSRQGKGEQ